MAVEAEDVKHSKLSAERREEEKNTNNNNKNGDSNFFIIKKFGSISGLMLIVGL